MYAALIWDDVIIAQQYNMWWSVRGRSKRRDDDVVDDVCV